MKLNDEQTVALRKWAYQHAEDIARHNASVLTTKQEPLNYESIRTQAQKIFEWVIQDGTSSV